MLENIARSSRYDAGKILAFLMSTKQRYVALNIYVYFAREEISCIFSGLYDLSSGDLLRASVAVRREEEDSACVDLSFNKFVKKIESVETADIHMETYMLFSAAIKNAVENPQS